MEFFCLLILFNPSLFKNPNKHTSAPKSNIQYEYNPEYLAYQAYLISLSILSFTLCYIFLSIVKEMFQNEQPVKIKRKKRK